VRWKVSSIAELFRACSVARARHNDRRSCAPFAGSLLGCDLPDLGGDRLVLVEADDQIAHARRYLIGPVLQDVEKRGAQGP
jgi:hypothetical protein